MDQAVPDCSPFGDGLNCEGGSTSYNQFTDDIHDVETNTEHTQFRQLSTTQGRWLSPDPAGLAAADLTNPQSLNLYTYVNNNPMNGTDPLGLDDIGEECDPFSPTGCPGGGGGGFPGDPNGPDPGCGDPFACPPSFPFPLPSPNGPPDDGGGGGGEASNPPIQKNPELSSETLGIPNGVHIQIPSILQVLGLAPNDPACDFIACGTGVGRGFQSATLAIPFCVAQPEVCALAGAAGLIYVGLKFGPAILQMARNQNKIKGFPTVADLQLKCRYVRTVTEPSISYPGGTSVEHQYNCAGTPWTIHELFDAAGVLRDIHVRPGSPKGGE